MQKNFPDALQEVKNELKKLRAEHSEEQAIELENLPVDLNISYSPTVKKIFTDVLTSYKQDFNIYKNIDRPQVQPGEPQENNLSKEVPQPEPVIDDSTAKYKSYVYHFSSAELIRLVTNSEMTSEDKHTTGEWNLYHLLKNDFNYITENQRELAYSINTMNKLKKAIDALSHARVNDALTVLRNAKRDDPHNRHLAFALSQIFYYKAMNGQPAFLPEARNEAKRATLSNDNFDRSKLLFYRYIYVICEAHFDKEKTVELMREFYLLSADSLTGSKGLFSHSGLHLKAWVLMHDMPDTSWTKFEIDSLLEIIQTVPGGVLMYDTFLRKRFSETSKKSNRPELQSFTSLEQNISLSIQRYNDILNDIDTYFDDQGYLIENTDHTWTIMNRYITGFLQSSPIPTLDSIYLNCSLNARHYSKKIPEDDALKSKDLHGIMFWQVWGISITPDPAAYSNALLPTKRVGRIALFLKQLDDLLICLSAYEETIISKDKWEIIRPYMPYYQYQSFIYVGAGPRAFKTPKDPYFSPMHRRWSRNEQAALPSTIIREQASIGAFTSIEEAVAAFYGIEKIINDPTHGLKARAKEALKMCLKDKEQREGRSEKTQAQAQVLAVETHFRSYWWVYLIGGPIAIALISMIASARSIGDIVNNLILIGGMIAVGIFLMFALQPQNKEKKAANDEDDDDLFSQL